MKALIGHNLKKAKEIAKQELRVKRMGEARFQMILDQGVKNGDFVIEGDLIKEVVEDDLFFDNLIEIEDETEDEVEPTFEVKVKKTHPPEANLDPRLSSSDLPRLGDIFYYRSYTGEVVQGEVKSVVCFAECANPNGTWQTVAYQDLHLKKKGVPKDTMVKHLTAYYSTNNHLDQERKRLINEIAELEAKVIALKEKA